MKKILFILGLVLFASCCSQPQGTQTNDPVEITSVNTSVKMFDEVREFKYKGHDYIWFRRNIGGYAGYDGGIVHNPDCQHPSHDKTEKKDTGYDL